MDGLGDLASFFRGKGAVGVARENRERKPVRELEVPHVCLVEGWGRGGLGGEGRAEEGQHLRVCIQSGGHQPG